LRELYNESEDTIWHIIARNGDVEIIQKRYFELDEREINFKNKAGLTPLDIAFAEGNVEMLKELIRCGAKNSKEDILNLIRNAIEKNNLEIAKELVKYGAKNSKEDILNLIEIAIRNKHSETCIFLISFFNASSDLNLENKEDEGKSGGDSPSCKPSCVKKILVDTLVNYEQDSGKNGSGSRG
jgi:ankyrin repeat protein